MLERLGEHEVRGVGLSREEEEEEEEGGAREAWEGVWEGVWSRAEDEVLRSLGTHVGDEEACARLGGRWTVPEVAERRELLRALGDEAHGWSLTRDELRRMREEGDGAELDEEEGAAEEAEEQ